MNSKNLVRIFLDSGSGNFGLLAVKSLERWGESPQVRTKLLDLAGIPH